MSEHTEFEALFKEKLHEHGLNFKKISESSGIAAKHLENLCAGRYDKLPPAPYLRGYLLRLGRLMDFDGEAWWLALKKEGVLTGSGPDDALPKNRFAKKPLRKILIISAVVVILALLTIFRYSAIVGKPHLSVSFPETETAVVTSDTVVLLGTASRGSTLTINGEVVIVEEDGTWSSAVLLEPGVVNAFEIRAHKLLGGNVSVTKKILYEPAVPIPLNGTTATSTEDTN